MDQSRAPGCVATSFVGPRLEARPACRDEDGSRQGAPAAGLGLAVAAALSLLAAARLTADSPGQLAGMPLEELMEMPVEFVSGVSKYEQSIRHAPAGVTVFTSGDIQDYGWRTLADALRAAPGFHVRNDRFYEYAGNRGFTRPYDYNNRTLILVDGHRINDAIYQQGSIGTEFILDPDLIDRIEIIRGPGSSIYGSNAFDGAINVIPKKGRDLAGGQAAAAVSSEPSVKGRVSVGDRAAGGFEYTVSATEWWSRGEREFDLPQSWRDAAPAVFDDLEAKDHDDTHHQSVFGHAAWRGFETEIAYVKREKDVLPPVYDTTPDAPARGEDERAYALLRAGGEPLPDAELSATVSLDFYNYDGLFHPLSTNFEPQLSYAASTSINTEIRWRQTLAERHTLIAGVERQDNLRQDIGRDNLATGERVVRVRENSAYSSPFIQVDWELAPRLILSSGLRYDYYSESDQSLTPRLGLIWDCTSATTFKLLYGESFRAPNVEERFASEAGVVANPDLDPEKNRSFELVAEHRLNDVWRLDAHVYHIASSDLITTILTNANPLDSDEISYDNGRDVVTDGFDLGAAAYFKNGLRLRASGTLKQSEEEATGMLVADAPRQLFKFNASTPLLQPWLRASGELQYVGDRREFSGGPVDSYVVANFTLRATRLWDAWDLSLSIYNVADTTWSDPKNEGQITAPPRSMVLRATYNF